MSEIHFSHRIIVPDFKAALEADGYIEELTDASVFILSQDEYDFLRASGGLFELFDRQLGTLIDDCEDERIDSEKIDLAINITAQYAKSCDIQHHATKVIADALQTAKQRGVFCEISNGLDTI